ncbi:MAG: hypothetical protein QM820_59090 [Minicystis sp.]
MLWIQQVTIIWTKATRGAPGARDRNQRPRAFPMLTPSSDVAMSFEMYRMDEADGFVPRRLEAQSFDTTMSPTSDLAIRRRLDESVALRLNYNPYVGQPMRPNSKSVVIRSGETAQLRTNGRYAGYYGQHYTELVFNAALGPDLHPEVFLRREPTHVLDIRADLF